jgi:hypothetical protein
MTRVIKLHSLPATVILADFACLLWDQGHPHPLTITLDVYKKHSNQAAIAHSIEEAYQRFSEHRSYDELYEQVLQIALGNRLRKWVPNGWTLLT